MEALAQDHFGSEWAEDARIRGFVEVASQAGAGETAGPADAKPADAPGSKEQFLAAVSHELRTPLNPILALTDSLRFGVYGEMGERQLEALGHMAENAGHLHRLIEDILDISSFSFGADCGLVLAPARVDELFTKMIGGIAAAAGAKAIGIRTLDASQLDCHFYIDNRRVEKVLAILLDNALKFTPAGGEITLGASADHGSTTISLSVEDTGIGISMEDQVDLFRSFGQLDCELARAYNGAGLGLGLAKYIAEQHDGTIALESAPGEGSKFTISLPLRLRSEELPALI